MILTKKNLKIAFVIYAASFLIINWDAVSWMFNYKEVSGLIDDFFTPYPSVSAESLDEYFSPNKSLEKKDVVNADVQYTAHENTIDIPEINISAPIVFSSSSNANDLEKDLNSGVVYYPGSVMPGQIGNIIILGHSAPPLWPHIKSDWIFSDLQKLKIGDQVYISQGNKQYTYIVKNIQIIQKGENIPTYDTNNKNILNLVSCWPPGKDAKRIIVQSELKTK